MKLVNDVVVLDLETTGTWIEKDRIVEVAMIKCLVDGKKEIYHKVINPGIPIPAVVCELIGISNQDVKGKPFFKDIAQEVLDFMGEADFAGFNVERFDLPLLERELSEEGLSFNWRTRAVYDAQKVYHLNEKRDLTAAYKYYCNKELKNAHSAMEDTQATLDIIEAQINRYGEGKTDIDVLSQFSYKAMADFYDEDRRFRWWNGNLYMMFGKYARKHSLQDVVKKDRAYLEWVLSANFSDEVKDLVSNALKGKFPKQDVSEAEETNKLSQEIPDLFDR